VAVNTGGLADTAGGFGAGDPQPVGQRSREFAAQLGCIGLLADLVDQRVLDGGQAAAHPFAALQHGQPFRGGQCVEGQLQGTVQVRLECVEDLDDLLAATRTHVRMITHRPDSHHRLPQAIPR
jgi:hypothetical protein